jgi:hypothetical protein
VKEDFSVRVANLAALRSRQDKCECKVTFVQMMNVYVGLGVHLHTFLVSVLVGNERLSASY